MLVRCLYASRPAKPLTRAVRDTLLDQSRRNNPKLGVTGLLCIADDIFIQVIEGGRDEVCDLFNTIVRDDRHTQVRLLIYEEISERQFGNWTMGQVDTDKINPAMLLKYFKRAKLDPFDCTGNATMALLNDLVASAAVLNRKE